MRTFLLAMAALAAMAPPLPAQLFRKFQPPQYQAPQQCRPGMPCYQAPQFQTPQHQPAQRTPAPPVPTVGVVPTGGNVTVLDVVPLSGEFTEIDLTESAYSELASVDRLKVVMEATVRVTVSGVCGSGTVVGRDGDGRAIVLTNAHVAGTDRGRRVNVQRWNSSGDSEKSGAAIIAAGYGRGMSMDFALVVCDAGFARDVTPIPIADRYPDDSNGVTTYGCPRCEWPSLQLLKLDNAQGQILKWYPEAIGGRSGSSLVDYTAAGPRVVGLLTWGGGGQGLGQSTPFLLQAMRGRLPRSFEMLPPGVRPLAAQDDAAAVAPMPARELPQIRYCELGLPSGTARVPFFTDRRREQFPMTLAKLDASQAEVDTADAPKPASSDLIDQIVEPDNQDPPSIDPPEGDDPGVGPPSDPPSDDPCDETREGPLARLFGFLRRSIVAILLAGLSGVAGYYFGRRT